MTNSEGTTQSERYLTRLAKTSFLSLWSYPNLFGETAKELCDLLVVFGNHILIFSDKDCAFGDSGNLSIDWDRWYRKAILKSAKQIWGAERWLKNNPSKIFTDAKCTQVLPINLPDPNIATIHRILVAHGASAKYKEIHGGSGSLMIWSDVIGDAHLASNGGTPFAVGQIDPSRGYLHVFDDTSLNIVMSTLDTISDFTNYLSKKEKFIQAQPILAAGEEELLAKYLEDANKNGEHDFLIREKGKFDVVVTGEGHWDEFQQNPIRQAQIKINKISYFWDALIERFAQQAIDGTQYQATQKGVLGAEYTLRPMARESRFSRRMLARALYEIGTKTESPKTGVRLVPSPTQKALYYLFLITSPMDYMDYDGYREWRLALLEAYLLALKLKQPDAQSIVGIALAPSTSEESSEDAMYLDASTWSEIDQQEASSLVEELGLLKNLQRWRSREYEYPRTYDDITNMHSNLPNNPRNKPCPCGSGLKYKHCCLKRERKR